ncbi:MAG: hypothetical protein ACK2UO_15475, partial [Caldilineaceae bacterium]
GFPSTGFLNSAQFEQLGKEGESPQAQKIYWDAIGKTADTQVLQAFISMYPDGPYTGAARAQVQAIQKAAQKAASAKPRPSKPVQQRSTRRSSPPPGSGRYTPKERRAIDAFNDM